MTITELTEHAIAGNLTIVQHDITSYGKKKYFRYAQIKGMPEREMYKISIDDFKELKEAGAKVIYI